MENLIKILSINAFWKIIFDPLIELNQEMEDIHRDRHKIRSIFKIIIAMLAGTILAYCSLNNPTIMGIIGIASEIFNFSQEAKPFFSAMIDIVICCHLGMWCGRASTRAFCKYYYGDPELYLPPDRLVLLEKKLKVHIEHITQKEIIDVVTFCIHKFNENSEELGGKKEDWKRTIESLIYDANMEAFYEQQEALYTRNEKINNTINRILAKHSNPSNQSAPDYGSIEHHTAELPRTFTLLAPQPQVPLDDLEQILAEQVLVEQEYSPKITLSSTAFNYNNFNGYQTQHPINNNHQKDVASSSHTLRHKSI